MKLSKKQAYMAMFYYLEGLYDLTKSNDLSGFLSGMILLDDDKPADPAVWIDWKKAVNKALEEIPSSDE